MSTRLRLGRLAGCFGMMAALLLSGASAATAATAGDLYIADTGNNRVVELPVGGSQTTVASGLGNGVPSGFSAPFGVTVDESGNLYVADTGNNRVVAVPGALIDPNYSFNEPHATALDASGNVYVADSLNGEVVEVYATPQCTQIGCTFEKPYARFLDYPTSVAMDAQGDGFVADRNLGQVYKYPAGGGSTTTVGSGLSSPEGVAVDLQGDVFIADTGNNRVVEEPAGGGSQTTVGSGLSGPTAVALDDQGDVFIADAGNNRVVEVAAGGGAQSTVLGSGLSGPSGVAVYDPPPSFTADAPTASATAGAAYSSYSFAATNSATFSVASGKLPPGLSLDSASGALTGTPTRVGSFTFAIKASNAVEATVGATHTITVTAATAGTPGDVYIADYFGEKVVKVAPGGAQTDVISSGLSRPSAVAVDAHGNVYVTDSLHNRVVEQFAVGGGQTTWGSGLSGPQGVAVDAQGNVYIADSGNNRVLKEAFDGSGQITLGSGLSNPEGVAVDAHGDVFIADRGNNRVVEEVFGGGQNTIGTGLSGPEGVAVDAQGDVLISEPLSHQVIKVPAGGGTQTTVGSSLGSPSGVAFDAAGNVYIADPNPSAQVVEVPAGGGSQTTVGSGLSYPTGVAAYAPPPAFTADSPPNARTSTAYAYTFAASVRSGEPPAAFVLASGTLPPGLNLNASTGVLSGTPTTPGTYTFAVEAENAATGAIGAQHKLIVGVAPLAGDLFIADASGRVMELPAGGGYTTSATVGSGLSQPAGVAVAGSGEDVYIADVNNHNVVKVAGATQTQTVVPDVSDPISTFTPGPYGVAADEAGNVYIANTASGHIDKILPNGSNDNSCSCSGYQPEGVAVDPMGDIFMPDPSDNWVREVHPNNTNELFTGFSGPIGVATDAVGDLYVADPGNHRVVKIPADGGPQQTITAGPANDAPSGVALDAYGNLFIADQLSGYIYEVPVGGGATITLPNPLNGHTYQPAGLAVWAPPPTFTADSPFSTALVGTAYSYTFQATTPANEPAARFSLVSGSLPPGVTLNSATGTLSGTPTTAGAYTFAIETENVANGSIGTTHTITVSSSGHTLSVARSGSGTVSSLPIGISCPGTCGAQYAPGSTVTLTATPATGSTFTGWSGGGCSGTGTCQVTLNADASVTATFATNSTSSTSTTSSSSTSTSTSTTTTTTTTTTSTTSGSGGGGSGSAVFGTPSTSVSSVTVPASCTGPKAAACRVSLQLTVTEKLRRGRVVAIGARKSQVRRKTVVLGQVSVRLIAGHRITVNVPLNRTGRKLLAKYHRLRATLTIRQLNGKPRTLVKRTVILRSPAKKPKHKH